MSSRIYNRLYVQKNREEGSEKLLFGYQFNEREILLKKDKETYFHIPEFTAPIELNNTSLIQSGAIGGPFPAASDRIFKSGKNFGNVTAHGTSTVNVPDGLWYCSWLYKNEVGYLRWLDRIYNPGAFVNEVAEEELFEAPSYNDSTRVFRDVPSQMLFEPGVLYKYFHIGEKTSKKILETFSGKPTNRLFLNLTNWGSEKINTASDIEPTIKTVDSAQLFTTTIEQDRTKKQALLLSSKVESEIAINYDETYNPTNEFSLTFWAQGDDWLANPSTQLAGNYSSGGGYGVFVENLSSFPFFVICETNYGHILFVNCLGQGYFDKIVQIIPGVEDIPVFAAIDMNNHVLVCNKDNRGTIYKFDNAGKLLASTRDADVKLQFVDFNENPLQLICGPQNSIYLLTDKMLYVLDDKLNRTLQAPQTFTENDVAAFRYDSINDTFEFNVSLSAYDSKFIENVEWYLSRSDGNLYKKDGANSPQLFQRFSNNATKFAIDPFNRLWVLHGNNELTILDSTSEPLSRPLFKTTVGLNTTKQSKNISFFTNYNSKQNLYEWRCIVVYSNRDEKAIYILDINGKGIKVINTNSLFDQNQIQALGQTSANFEFLGKGDFTGYEHKRVFKTLSPYKNKNQIVLKGSFKDSSKKDPYFTSFSRYFPLTNTWEKNSWKHFAVVFQHKTMTLFINSQPVSTIELGGRYELSYLLQPIFFIGTSGGSQAGLNQEIQTISDAFNGKIADLKIYDYALSREKLELFLAEALIFSDITWMVPVPMLQYVEKIERMFKHRLPGYSTPFYRVKLKGSQISNETIKSLVFEQIKNSIREMQPAQADCIEIEWIE